MTTPNEIWRIVNRVREAGYDWFTLDEKKRLHDLVVRLKARGAISPDDLQWLQQADANLCGVASLAGIFSRRRKGRAP
jgi:hypothetical protein